MDTTLALLCPFPPIALERRENDLGQSVTSIKIDLVSLIRALPADRISESAKAESILRLVDQTIQSVRRIATELRPGILDDLGLVAAVERAAEEFAARSGTELRLNFRRKIWSSIMKAPRRFSGFFKKL